MDVVDDSDDDEDGDDETTAETTTTMTNTSKRKQHPIRYCPARELQRVSIDTKRGVPCNSVPSGRMGPRSQDHAARERG